MIALVLAMAWSRRGQAVTLALLAMFGVSAAVAAPAFLRAGDRAVAAGQAATASGDERSVQVSETLLDHRGDRPDQVPVKKDVNITETGGVLTDLPGFRYTYAGEFPTIGIEPDTALRTLLVYRQNVCDHLVMATGRCLVGEGEVILGVETARRNKIATGDAVTLTYGRWDPSPDEKLYQPDGAPKQFLVAGTYRVPAPEDPYWGTHGYFRPDTGARPGEPAFVNAASFRVMDHGINVLSVDGLAGPGALDVDRLPAVRAGLSALQARTKEFGPPVELTTGLPTLLARIDAGRAAAHLIVPVLAVALVLLACATIFLAVGYGTEGRRPELAVVALRGSRWGQRWWLATGENLIAILAGTVAGCVVGQLLVNVYAAVSFPGVGADAGVSSLRYAPVAALAAVLTALLAERRQLVSPVTELLRRAPRVPHEAGAIAVAAAVALLAIVAGAQLRVSDGTLTGVGTFAAALIMAALAQVAARALLPAVTLLSGRALRRGRLGWALAGFQLSRRPGAARLFALLAAAVAVVGYAACAIDVGGQVRVQQAELGTGAARVLTVGPVGRQQLLSAVRAADPAGAYAMAVVQLPAEATAPAGLAVDTTRLAAVANWPGGPESGRTAARALRPAAPEPVTVTGAALSLDLSATGLRAGKPVSLAVVLSSLTGRGDVVLPLGDVRTGRHSYARTVPVCQAGCRLNALQITESTGVQGVTGRLVLHGLNPAGVTTPLDPGHWRATAGGTLAAAPDGLRIDITTLNGLPTGLLVQPGDTPYPLPVITAGLGPTESITGLDRRTLPTVTAQRIPAIPGAGTPATLIDLEYADRVSIDGELTGRGQVWLSPRAPAGIVTRLEAAGLTIGTETRAAQVRRQLDEQGPALALGYYAIMGCLAAALAAGALILAATVDRSRRIEDLTALRDQGLRRPAVRRAALWTYPGLVAGAVPTGVGIALLAWWLTGWALPLAGLHPPALPLPAWPRALVMAATGVTVLLVLALVAYLAGRRTLKDVP